MYRGRLSIHIGLHWHSGAVAPCQPLPVVNLTHYSARIFNFANLVASLRDVPAGAAALELQSRREECDEGYFPVHT